MKPLSNSFVYVATNKINGKRYVGQTRQGIQRWREHKRTRSGSYFSNAIKKHGPNAFVFAVLEYCNPEDLVARENYWIAELKPEYNLILSCDGVNTERSAESRKRNSDSAKRRMESLEERERLRNATIRQFADEASRQHQAVVAKRVTTELWKDKEYREKVVAGRKRQWENNQEARDAAAKRMRERSPSKNPEVAKKISEARKAYWARWRADKERRKQIDGESSS